MNRNITKLFSGSLCRVPATLVLAARHQSTHGGGLLVSSEHVWNEFLSGKHLQRQFGSTPTEEVPRPLEQDRKTPYNKPEWHEKEWDGSAMENGSGTSFDSYQGDRDLELAFWSAHDKDPKKEFHSVQEALDHSEQESRVLDSWHAGP